jgi:hypothetical protein
LFKFFFLFTSWNWKFQGVTARGEPARRTGGTASGMEYYSILRVWNSAGLYIYMCVCVYLQRVYSAVPFLLVVNEQWFPSQMHFPSYQQQGMDRWSTRWGGRFLQFLSQVLVYLLGTREGRFCNFYLKYPPLPLLTRAPPNSWRKHFCSPCSVLPFAHPPRPSSPPIWGSIHL